MLIGSFGPFVFLVDPVLAGCVPETQAPVSKASKVMQAIKVADRIQVFPSFIIGRMSDKLQFVVRIRQSLPDIKLSSDLMEW
jgi:hypothetical protein